MTASWPALSMAETLSRLTAPGAPFEMRRETVLGRNLRTYVKAVPHLRAVFDASRGFGARDFLVYEDERVSFDAHWRAATALGHALRDRYGVLKGDRVAVAMRNFPDWSICAWASLAIGAVLVPLNAWEPGPVLARMIADAGVRLVIADGERAARLADHGEGLPPLIVTREPQAQERLEDLIGEPGTYASLDPAPLPDPGLVPDDDATIFYTSGTTGAAKGAVGVHRNIATNLVNTGFRNARAAVRRGDPIPKPTGAKRVQLLPVPFFHVTGFQSGLVPAIANGTTVILMHRWDPERALDLIEAERINMMTLVPSQAVQLVDASSIPGRDLTSVDAVGYGGAAASAQLATKVRATFPNAFPGQGYGATETSSLVAANSAEDMMAHPGSVGTIMPCTDLRIVDEDGGDVALGSPGELLVSGPQVVRGYWNQPDATSEAFAGGWYRTGDIGKLDDDGFITLLDRAKDMLIRGGENIYCVEIEDVLASHPAVAEAAVIGVPDPVLGEVVGAVVRLRPGASLDAEGLSRHAAASLAAHKRPVVIHFHAEPLPRNAAGKVLKRQLKAVLLAPANNPSVENP